MTIPAASPDEGLEIDTSEHYRAPASGPAEPLSLPGLPTGAALRVLRRLGDGRLRAGLVDLPPGWRIAELLVARGAAQIFVLEGQLEIEGRRIGRYGFIGVPRGAVVPALVSPAGTRLILILDADTDFLRSDRSAADPTAPAATVVADALTEITPIVPVINGRRLEGFERRVLWMDEATGADTRLLRIPSGFEGSGPGWHPVNEEIFLLEGDVAPDDTRRMEPGDYLLNPARSVHGFHEHSRQGCLLLEWHDGHWAHNAWAQRRRLTDPDAAQG